MRFAYDFKGPSRRTFDVDGRMFVADCRISKANVCPYYGREIPGAEVLGLEPNRVYQMYRDPIELERAAPTFANLQLMMVHIPVNAEEPAIELTVGTMGSDVRFEAPYLVSSLKVWTAEAIALIESKAQAQLSCSYRYTPVMDPGTTPEGVAYDGRMCNIIGNHVALVEEGRAGPDVVVNDQLTAEVMPVKFPKFLAAIKSFLKADADPVAVDAAIDAVMADGKPRATAFLRIAAALKPLMAKDADFSVLASDAAVEAEMKKAEDAGEEDEYEDDPEKPGQKRKKNKAADASDPDGGPPAGKIKEFPNMDAAIDAQIKSRKLVTADDAKALADAASVDATAKATAHINALHAARADVLPLVGTVALDSAEAVYRYAFDKLGVKVDGVHASAFPALVEAEKGKRAASTAKPVGHRMAADSASAIGDAIPGLSRISK